MLCGCGERPVDHWGGGVVCWACFVIADKVRYERSKQAIKAMKDRVNAEHGTTDNVERNEGIEGGLSSDK